MWDLLKWSFPKHWKTNDTIEDLSVQIDQGEYWKNIKNISLPWIDELYYRKEGGFEEQVVFIIDQIVDEGIDIFHSENNIQINTLHEDTLKIWTEMYNEASTIIDTFDYINFDQDTVIHLKYDDGESTIIKIKYKGEYIMSCIILALSKYSDKVLLLLEEKHGISNPK
jgi:hypothetical protein